MHAENVANQVLNRIYEPAKRAVSMAFTVALLPGTIVHASSRRLAAALLGLAVRRFAWFGLPGSDVSFGRSFHGDVRVPLDGRPWRSLAVTVAPTVLGLPLALATFRSLRRSLALPAIDTGMSVFAVVGAYGSSILGLPPLEGVVSVVGLWVGCSVALRSLPDRTDGIRSLETVRSGENGSIATRLCGDALFAVGTILGVRFTLQVAVLAVLVSGVEFAVSMWPYYLAGLASVWYFERDLVDAWRDDRPIEESTPALRVLLRGRKRRATYGVAPTKAELDRSVDRLDHADEQVRRLAAQFLGAAAADDPERLAAHAPPACERVVEEWDFLTESALVRYLIEVTPHVDAYDPMAEAAVALLADDSDAIQQLATELVGRLSEQNADAFRSRVSELVERLERESDRAARQNLAVAIRNVARDSPGAVAPYESPLRQFAESKDGADARALDSAMEELQTDGV
ncbi:hypothetical protein I7X12_18345 [Halosimplex litoreum]|uniref:HEAT repeat-containing protein n=1 Tax=Halosimplex litoreum TaxID=1198301 RepID=A0A7T3FY11_9EURY|nr:hypothetical protein [Halosimplex litoreum]QPV62662.1 hypothetical protein I7X12_18345 [Halosimplex litoreum]